MPKGLYLIIILLLILSGCSKPANSSSGSSIAENKPPQATTLDPEVLAYGNTLANINDGILSGRIVETLDFIYYAYQNSILKINRQDLTEVDILLNEEGTVSNLIYRDTMLYYIVVNSSSAQLKRIDLASLEIETLTTDVSATDPFLAILNESLYFTNQLSYFVKADLDAKNAKLFGYTMIINPRFDGTYFYGTGYDLTASSDWLRVYQTNPVGDKSTIFFEGASEAFAVYPAGNTYVLLTYSGNTETPYTINLLNPEGKLIDADLLDCKNPLGSLKGTSYYFLVNSTVYKLNLATNDISTAEEKDLNYSLWLIHAYGQETSDYIFYKTSSGTVEAYSKKQNKIISVYPKEK